MDKIGISEFYAGKNIFVTGATGFLGKALIEKLLRSCPDIGKIYALVRPKKGKNLDDRLTLMFSDGLFDTIKRDFPGIIERKVVPLKGNVAELGLGLNPEDREIIQDSVSVIFHNAASVRFDDSLKDAVFINLRGVRETAQLALDTKHLEVLVHVSTAFANCDQLEVDEILYRAKANWKYTIEIAEQTDVEILKVLTEKYLDGMPNTYTFTKSLGEHCVNDMCKGKIPVVIMRPSIVVSTMKEPVTGWIDNYNGPVGILLAFGKGIMRTLYCKPDKRPDYIPVDITVKSMVVASWDTALQKDVSEAKIIHASSYKFYWIRPNHKEIAETCLKVSNTVPLNNILWTLYGHTSQNSFEVYARIILFQLLPAVLIDAALKMTGRKPLLKNIQRRIYVAQVALRYFINQEWSFNNQNLLALQEKIPWTDQKAWNYDFASFDINEYTLNSLIGGRRYVLKEMDDTIPEAKRHSKRIKWADRILKIMFYFLLFVLAYKWDLFHQAADTIDRLVLKITSPIL